MAYVRSEILAKYEILKSENRLPSREWVRGKGSSIFLRVEGMF